MKRARFLVDNAPFLAAGALLTFMSSFGQTFFISVFAGGIRETFGLSHGAWGGIYMLGTGLSALVMLWAGALTDVFRVRLMGPVVLIGLAAACLAMALNPSVWALPLVIFALRFFGQGMSSHIAMVAMARWFVATRGRALTIAALGFKFGEAVLPIAFVALLALFRWQSLWIVGAALCLLGAPLLWRLLGKERIPSAVSHDDSSTGMKGVHWRRAEALRNPLFWLMVPAILGPSAFVTAFFFHQVLLAETKGISHVELVAYFPLFTVMSFGAMVASGWALDRIGTARLMPFYLVPLCLAFVVFSVASGPVSMMIGFLFLALTAGANATLPYAFWAEFYGTAHVGAIKATAAAVMVLGSAIGPFLTGALVDAGIGLEVQFLGIAAFFTFATALMVIGIGRAGRFLSVG